MYNNILGDKELSFIKGGGDPVKPVTPPRDRYDDEEESKATIMSANSEEEEFNWRKWLKKWLDKRF